jgi:hypothetical protein
MVQQGGAMAVRFRNLPVQIAFLVADHYHRGDKPLYYTNCHNNVPKKGWWHTCCNKKAFRNQNVFLTTTISIRTIYQMGIILQEILINIL